VIDVRDYDSAVATMREAGLRATPQRRAVIEVLVGDTSHPHAEDVAARVVERMPGVSLSTVYKTLGEFAQIGLIQRLDAGPAMRFDPDTTEHAHLACTRCGCVVDVPLDLATVRTMRAAAGELGARADKVSVDIAGICPSCASH